MPTAKQPTNSLPARGAPKLFDVAHPGKTVATNTSKPVLISNRPVMQDPMVVTALPAADSPAPVLKPAKKLVIKPIHTDVVPEAEATPEPPVTVPVEASEPPTAMNADVTPASRPAAQPAPETSLAPPVTSPPPVVAPAASNQDKQLSPADVDSAKQANRERAAELQKIIDTEQYFLPINSVENRRTKRIIAIGSVLIIVLGLAWYDTALDAGLVTNTFNVPHSHFLTKK